MMPPRTSFRRPPAFTLLELLIAVAIFAIVLTAINGVLYGAMRLRSKTARTIEEALPIQQTVAILKRDLQGIVAPGGILTGPLQSGAATGGMLPQGATTLYTCTGALDPTLPWGDVQKVAYYLKNPDDPLHAAGQDLVRAVSRNLLAPTQQEWVEQWLMSGVERLQLAFYDGNTWRDSWDSTTPNLTTGQTNNLPTAIKVQIDLAANYGESQTKAPVQLVVPLVAQARTNRTQTLAQ
jgi:general secretion pathway protein J